MSEELFKAMAQSILDGDHEVSAKLAKKALDQGIDPLVDPRSTNLILL
jgi:methanogenic corrinoid protein MtbC1